MAMANDYSRFIGSKISLISKAENRFEGILTSLDLQESNLTLSNVQSFGNETRPTVDPFVPANKDTVYDHIVFRGSEIKGLNILGPLLEEAAPSTLTISEEIPNANDDPPGFVTLPHPHHYQNTQYTIPPLLPHHHHHPYNHGGFFPPPYYAPILPFQPQPQPYYHQYRQYPGNINDLERPSSSSGHFNTNMPSVSTPSAYYGSTNEAEAENQANHNPQEDGTRLCEQDQGQQMSTNEEDRQNNQNNMQDGQSMMGQNNSQGFMYRRGGHGNYNNNNRGQHYGYQGPQNGGVRWPGSYPSYRHCLLGNRT